MYLKSHKREHSQRVYDRMDSDMQPTASSSTSLTKSYNQMQWQQ